MKATENTLRDYLKSLGIPEDEFLTNIKIKSISTITAALHLAVSKPEKGDWRLIYFIKTLYPKFELEHFSKKTEPLKLVIPAELNTEKPSKQLEEMFRMMIGNKLKALRKSKGFLAEDIAEAIGMTTNNYSAMENGRSHLNCYRLHLISKKLNVSYQTIIGIDPEEKDPKSLSIIIKEKDQTITTLNKALKATRANELKLQNAINELKANLKKL